MRFDTFLVLKKSTVACWLLVPGLLAVQLALVAALPVRAFCFVVFVEVLLVLVFAVAFVVVCFDLAFLDSVFAVRVCFAVFVGLDFV